MCGIAGVLTRRFDGAGVAKRMAEALTHRGPDDTGLWTENGIALSHRRLSILDLSPQGHQPMVSADGRYVISFNGEIYNHQILRDELAGIQWRGHSDTEVMLAAIGTWGLEKALSRFVGMFAIALWDCSERRLHLIRDRMGEKPLYYGWQNGLFAFGSELKALRQCPGFGSEIDREALALYLRHTYIPAPYTIYRGVYKLEPGCMLSLGVEDAMIQPYGRALRAPLRLGEVELRRWWSLRDAVVSGQARPIADEQAALDQLEGALRDAISLQSLADVPLGAFLSGGVDSSLVVALMQSQAKTRVRTFTIGFREKAYDEAPHARAVARHLGTEHLEMYVTAADALNVIPRLPDLYDEPFADSSQIPTFLLCSEARRHLTVALSGDAGDELFGGYNRYFWVRKIWSKVSWAPLPYRRLLGRLLTSVSPHRWDALYSVVTALQLAHAEVSLLGDKLHKLAARLESVKDDDALFYSLISEWQYPEEVVIGASEPATLLTQREQWPSLPHVEQRMMFLDGMTYLPDNILAKVDRAAMGASLETRAPFLDHRVVELAWRIPLDMKLRNGKGKWALRQLLYKYVPSKLIERPKHGFGIPLGDWLRGPLREWAEDLLSEARLRGEGFFNPGPIRLKWDEHVKGARNWEYALWPILMFEAWFAARH